MKARSDVYKRRDLSIDRHISAGRIGDVSYEFENGAFSRAIATDDPHDRAIADLGVAAQKQRLYPAVTG